MVTVTAETGVAPRGGPRAATEVAHRGAVERVIATLRQRFSDEDLSLRDMAAVASSSPYHFERVFRRVTRLSPGQFLAALRMQAAKRLLETTSLRVTDVCFEVGYNSLGTFTRRFSELVGVSPGDYRRLTRAAPPATEPLARLAAAARRGGAPPGIEGLVEAPADRRGPLVVGVFATPLPQGQPLACAFLPEPGVFHLPRVADGLYFVFAAALDGAAGGLSEAVATTPLRLRAGLAAPVLRLRLRPPVPTDPPLLVCLPLLVRRELFTAQARETLRT